MKIFFSLMTTPFEAVSITFVCTLVPVLWWRRRLVWPAAVKWLYWLLLVGVIFRLVTYQRPTGRYNLFLVPTLVILLGWQIVQVGELLVARFPRFAIWRKWAILLSFAALLVACGAKFLRVNPFNRYMIDGALAIKQAGGAARDLIIQFGKHANRLEYYADKRVVAIPELRDTGALLDSIRRQLRDYSYGVDRIWLVTNLRSSELTKAISELEKDPGCRIFYHSPTNNHRRRELVIFQYDVPEKFYSLTTGSAPRSRWLGEAAPETESRNYYAPFIAKGYFAPEQNWARLPSEWRVSFGHWGVYPGTFPRLKVEIDSSDSAPVLKVDTDTSAVLVSKEHFPFTADESLVIDCESEVAREIHVGWYLLSTHKIFIRYEVGGIFLVEPHERIRVRIPVRTESPDAKFWAPVIGIKDKGGIVIYEVATQTGK